MRTWSQPAPLLRGSVHAVLAAGRERTPTLCLGHAVGHGPARSLLEYVHLGDPSPVRAIALVVLMQVLRLPVVRRRLGSLLEDVFRPAVAALETGCTIWYMSRYFETTRHIDAPTEQVWGVLFDVAHWPEWTPTIDSVELLDDGPFQVGSRARVRQPRLPRAQWEVTEIVAGRNFTWEATGPGMRTIARHEVVPDNTGARVTLSIEQTGPMGAVAATLWRRLTQRYIELEAESLDARVTRTPAA
jgi:uncharacterized membrane protein